MGVSLDDNWELVQTDPESFADPSALQEGDLVWQPAIVPGTVAQSFSALDKNNDIPINFDDKDYWYRCRFKAGNYENVLIFDGLATLADVWLNGKKILSSNNMFVRHKLDVSDSIKDSNKLVICFRSLNHALRQKRPRPKWKTRLITNQQMRWFRTTLLGRIPGWSAAPAAVGPWRAITLTTTDTISVDDVVIKTATDGKTGTIAVSIDVSEINKPLEAKLLIDDHSVSLAEQSSGSKKYLSAKLKIDNVKLWWPHTHGEPCLYPASLELEIDGHAQKLTLDPVGFKITELKDPQNSFVVLVNNEKIFCRGACWTINDLESLTGSIDKLRQTLSLMRDAGANMIRIGGTMVYEQQAFYSLCDELGIMVWQDFMFANMDYPVGDDGFHQSVKTEVTQVLQRLRKHPCVSVYCGNSEIDQQAAMLGMDKTAWRSKLFSTVIPDLCAEHHSDIPYVASTPMDGTLPFHVNQGLSHYYGVGAYLRPVTEVRQHDVRFTSECLGFANIPIAKTRNKVLSGDLPVTHDPRWKARTPRDSGTGWDFEDVRDHYLKTFYGVDPVNLRCFDSERYMALSEAVTGEVMARVFAEWRSTHSQCNGGLVWFLKDFWPGAGWGIIDGLCIPKACYYYLKRSWQPVAVLLTNETINGADIHVVNESKQAFDAVLELVLLQDDHIVIASGSTEITIDSGEKQCYQADSLLGAFYDVTYSYRFGPARHNIVAARLKSDTGDILSEDFLFPQSSEPTIRNQVNLKATAIETEINTYALEIISDTFMHTVNLETPGYIADANFFHLLPNHKKTITLQPDVSHTSTLKGFVGALNLPEPVRIEVNKK